MPCQLGSSSLFARPSRRSLLQIGGLATCGLGWGDAMRVLAAPADNQPRARSIILLWLWGGPSHIDSFDLKPHAPVEYRGPYRPIATRAPGMEICELLPELARRADRFSIIRSLHHNSNDHGIAGTIGLTGADSGAASLGGVTLPGQLKAAQGSIVSKLLQANGALPSFVALGGNLHQGKRRIAGEGGGPLGPQFDPFRLDYDPESGVKIPQLDLVEGLTSGRITSRRQLWRKLDELAAVVDHSAATSQRDSVYDQAFSMLASTEFRRSFDLSNEPEAMRERYGSYRFGQCCLLARRLVESGVRFVQVNWSSHVEPIEDTGDGGWDTHDRHFPQFQDRHSWMLDQACSALLDDLSDRGRLNDTLVIAVGEFGRTPKINPKAGRDHWNQCYSALIAGGAFRRGAVIGASDARAESPTVLPLTPADLFSTAFDQIGITTTRLTTAGLTPVGRVVDELCGR
jgi:hypothetical protein